MQERFCDRIPVFDQRPLRSAYRWGALIVRIVISALALSLVALAFLAPTIQTFVGYPAGESIYAILANICHQFPTRSLWLFSRPAGLCARCVGVYAGLSIGGLLALATKSRQRGLLISFGLMVICSVEWYAELATLFVGSNMIRFLVGASAGLGIWFLVWSLIRSNYSVVTP